ncbi:MSC_0882 family membrane protein [Spiroplasma endosymbiont of Colias croceus]|uniref:MSC_0882 family membrane protein n=1 Tax=Spiroplasma endosymbiont of Colias croceus TaxID=3066310 RepID=UPI003BB1AAA0
MSNKLEPIQPSFIIIFYRKMIVRKIILNWITAFVFLFGLLSLGILFFLNNQYDNGNKDFYIGFWKLFSLKNLDSEINITLIILIIVYAINIFSLIITKKNKNDIIKNFGYEVISSEEIENLKKKTNKICLIVFLSVITILLFLIFILLRKRKLKKI